MGSGPVAGRDSWVPLSWTKGFFNRSCSAAIAHPDGLGAPLDILIERTFTRTIVLVSVGAPTVRRQERGGVCRCLLLWRCPQATTHASLSSPALNARFARQRLRWECARKHRSASL